MFYFDDDHHNDDVNNSNNDDYDVAVNNLSVIWVLSYRKITKKIRWIIITIRLNSTDKQADRQTIIQTKLNKSNQMIVDAVCRKLKKKFQYLKLH